ncbi:hypothetical protein Agabi119p4_11547 [Agaricus bisporus var. burnettii]|uniref:PAN2-PAN3 deadenylation complex subunit PAN3 n=1 Tax=Agaricus bisporus var. burnettii TaxID=192524 RepID=A0A8H7EV91_AGABI|nr:hypothetical protein Agabi119p4_11547 [Agaricus bisporus var. burnettii]
MAFFARPQSTAVRISQPTDDPEPRRDTVQRQCRNIVIYGHCKYQDKGCQYFHPPPDAPASPPPTAALSAHAINAPIFVPKAAAVTHDDYDEFSYTAADAAAVDDLTSGGYYDDSQYQYVPPYDPNGIDSLYLHPPPFLRQPLNYLLYTPSLPDDSSTNTHFIPPASQLRQHLQSQSESIRTVAPPGLPDECQGYHSFVPLEPTSGERRKLGNWYSTVYRAIRVSDGRPYALRRIENYRLMHQSAFSAIELWSSIRHPSIVPVQEAFTTKAFNDNSLLVSYAYFPDAQTLYDVHFKSINGAPPPPPPSSVPPSAGRRTRGPSDPASEMEPQNSVIPERTLWSYIVQIASAIKKVHETGNPVRMIDATKILVTGQNRIRISSCGIIDLLMHNSLTLQQSIEYNSTLLQEDLTLFGRLVFSLSCGTIHAWTAPQFQKSLDWMTRWYQPDLKSVALYLISKPGVHKLKTIDHLMEMIRPKVQAEMEEALLATDRLQQDLLSELENARLVRLLCKFGFINERPEFALEPRWSETGDRYIIKLFRDYVFHQVDEHGNPIVNMSHVLTCLNKLDAGSEEKVMLVSRDDTSCLVVSYKEIKACMEGAFSDLARPSTMVTFQSAR